jgi:hypothetical protein
MDTQSQEPTQKPKPAFVPEPILKELAKQGILEEKSSGQHKILDVNTTDYGNLLALCSRLGYKILKAKRLPHGTHAVSCLWVKSGHKKERLPCSCYYYGTEDGSLPEINKWTVMA